MDRVIEREETLRVLKCGTSRKMGNRLTVVAHTLI